MAIASSRRRNVWIRYGILGLTAVLLICLAIWIQRTWRDQFIKNTTASAKSALENSQFDEARRFAKNVLVYRPNEPSVLLIAAQAVAAKSDWQDAFALCERLSPAEQRSAARRLFSWGEAAGRTGHARRAEVCLRLALRLDPQNIDATYILASVLGAEGRAWEARPLAQTLIEAYRYDVPQLLLVGATDEFYINNPKFVAQCLTSVPDDPLPLLGSARNSIIDNDLKSAEKFLLQITTHDPLQIEAQARLGRLLVDGSRDDSLRAWNQSLPAAADDHPEIWVTRGLFAMRHNQQGAAIRCFGQATLLDPNHRIGHLHLGRLLLDAGQPQLASEFQLRAERLSEIFIPLTTFKNNLDPLLVRRIADLCELLGRPHEAVAWAELLLRIQPDAEWAHQLSKRLRERYSNQPPWIVNESRLADRIDFERLPRPDWEPTPNPVRAEAVAEDPKIHFSEDAAKLGINFQYYNDGESSENTLRIFETLGGGIAVIDFDCDGWPDLYAAQGSIFPRDPDPPVHLDRLFRNRGDAHFDDVTKLSGLGDSRYSQGVTVGDFDQDGFPDLYVANIGCNRLIKNNGDGTFTDVTEAAGLHDDDWTASCVLADLNGDTWPDLYAVNYATGAGVYTRVCGTQTRPKSCHPTVFEPCQDRIWMNLGDGHFEEQTTSALIVERSAGRGLGIVATAIDRPDRPNLFIGNDTDPNFWYVNQVEKSGGPLRFDETAVISGLAYDADGLAQACMGIAAGDANRDGRLDFFVTNFFRESNTLYLQQPDMTFLDKTREAGLREPSLLMLGFGAQFLDADADGWLDLMLTNGHVYNDSHLGDPFRMRPQFLRNTSGGRYVEVLPERIGPYFEKQLLGRALVRWDWNRDGLPDVAISHLDAPLAVLTNRTGSPNHTLVLTLCGVESNREAVGAMIHVTTGSERWMTTITAGDGYMASNDRRLILGLGRQKIVDEIVIQWPSGKSQTVQNIATDQEVLLVEGRMPLPMRSFSFDNSFGKVKSK